MIHWKMLSSEAWRSTFPRSRAILERVLDGVTEAERRQITAGTLARLYDFDAAARN